MAEDEIFSMRTTRFIATAVGQQLDNFGKIVDQPRLGFSDDFYRILLYAKIGINNSQGDPETIISILKLLTQSTQVQYQNLGNATISLGYNGTIDPSLYNFFYQQMQRVVAAGVKINGIYEFSDDAAFAFAGTDPTTRGFGTVNDASIGGKLGTIIPNIINFGFDGISDTTAGFGSVFDSTIGGNFATI